VPTEIVVETEDRPGVLAQIGEMFGEIEINILAVAAFTHEGKGILHFVVDDAGRAQGSLEAAGFKVMTVREVLNASLDDRPGEIGRFARKLADAGVNITSFYTAGSGMGDTEIILAVDNVEAAKGRI
jgi:hypothetical protein